LRTALERDFRADYGRCVAALARRLGAERLELIEDAVQDAIARALERWDAEGAPANRTHWIIGVAHNRAVDRLRGEARLAPLGDAQGGVTAIPGPAVDDELALMFLCCHPSLPRAAQVALTLKVACGLGVPQIARAFLTDERTLAQRIVRAKQLLRREDARFEVPEPSQLPARLEPILDVLYLVFSEGYSPSDGDLSSRADLCVEALRLVRLLAELPSGAPPTAEALRALFCFQLSRARARTADDGSLLLLHEQDRTRWDEALAAEGFACLGRAAHGRDVSRFHIEAGIAACHAAAPSHQATEWPLIVSLYDDLRAVAPSPVVDVNRAIAIGMARSALAGLDELDAIPEREIVGRYPYALAAYAELHASLGHVEEARGYLKRALEHQPAGAQRRLLERKLAALG
jgi:RNA polymerase sigma-70 factor (ECF subfamily)